MTNSLTPTAWTNPSVLKLAGDSDPISAVIDRARRLVLDATDRGWKGPPFDPIALCALLGIKAIPREDIADARIVPTDLGALEIEFNPLRPRGRVRFSVAHEIAHTLFPDCADEVRNRSARHEMRGDEWQLEMLCNIAAAEVVMPAGHFPDLKGNSLDVNDLMDLRRRYDVSTEALFLRVLRHTEHDCVMFSAARDESGPQPDVYRIQYFMPSRNASFALRRGLRLPDITVVSECTAIGYTAKGSESWETAADLAVQCVGIPPYPGRKFPRVIGIASPTVAGEKHSGSVVVLKGNALEPRGSGRRIVTHIVNDRTPTWGGGFARGVAQAMPHVQSEFREWTANASGNMALGQTHFSSPDASGVVVASMVAQHGLGASPSPRIRYNALSDCLVDLARFAREQNGTVHMPRIGTGNAGGEWEIISTLIDEFVCSTGVSVTVYDLPNAALPSEGLFTK